MRIESIHARDFPPLREFGISGLGDVVIIAGANGSGKTRLKQAMIGTFSSPKSPSIEITVGSTRAKEEEEVWGRQTLTTSTESPNAQLQKYMKSRTRGGTYTGSVVQIDSGRAVQAVAFQSISYLTPDPDDEDLPYTYFLSGFTGRWQDIVNKIYQKAANRDYKIAQYAKEHPEGDIKDALAQCPDPFVRYQEVFTRLLPGKKLESIDPRQPKEFQFRQKDSQPLPFSALSSGEQEVVKIAFNLLWKRIRHCVILLDEPELHLHPTLAFRLIESLKEVGNYTNQFFFFTHSADLISTYYSTGNVYFIDDQAKAGNQAQRLSELDPGHTRIARAMADRLGLFAVGKKLILVEGQHASIDRLTYHQVAQGTFSDAHVLPAGSVENVLALGQVADELQQSIFGVEFFMIRDRDGLSKTQVQALEKNPRIRCLARRHVENYFLSSEVISETAERLCLDPRWKNPDEVKVVLQQIAENNLNQALMLAVKQYTSVNGTMPGPRVASVQDKSIDQMQSLILDEASEGLARLSDIFDGKAFSIHILALYQELQDSLATEDWKVLFPGKLVFSVFCATHLKEHENRVRQAYLDIALSNHPDTFADIRDIFEGFRQLAEGKPPGASPSS